MIPSQTLNAIKGINHASVWRLRGEAKRTTLLLVWEENSNNWRSSPKPQKYRVIEEQRSANNNCNSKDNSTGEQARGEDERKKNRRKNISKATTRKGTKQRQIQSPRTTAVPQLHSQYIQKRQQPHKN
ncbi:hypothetical protein CHS0354_017144 [Potamilus streckersoni]|uniref:Uncharacterized protein n=1 Tax=Potamilus streckersoni TaxID=2493646 RepID=A0AAE0TEL5_9BIVA|nr:hypothetical protein CHS0354_017144 [Potamilus streckersoni]